MFKFIYFFQVRVFSLQFSPTGQAWAAATTEGLLIYSLNTGLVFDPWSLELGITPTSVKESLTQKDYSNGMLTTNTDYSFQKYK